jgi:vacuolar-type H+-ATPase subunit E/Vma4
MEENENAEALVGEIKAMAGRESAGIVSRAEAEAAGLLSAAAEEAEREGRARVEAARAAAAQRSFMLLSALPLETDRLRAARLEALLSAVKEKAAARLAGEECRGGAVTAALAAEALRGMEGNSFVLTLPPGGLREDLRAEIEKGCEKGPLELTFGEDRALAGGVIARDTAGRQYWDNSFRARLERFWPELRGRLAAGLPGGKKNEQA